MTSTIAVGGRNDGPPAARRKRGPMTPINAPEQANFYRAPVSRPAADTRREILSATSVDGLWKYDRLDDHTTPWAITLIPTGQSAAVFLGTINAAREATASGAVLVELRGAAFRAAFDGTLAADRQAEGQRWLAVHMRLAGADEAEARCECGGLLVVATRDGRYAHVDGCAECYTHGTPGIRPGDGCVRHRFCAAPRPVECVHAPSSRCGRLAVPDGGGRCERGRGECCGCCSGE